MDLSALEITEEWLKQDLVPLRGEHILKEEGIFAGTDSERKHDLRGHSITQQLGYLLLPRGYGSVRLLETLILQDF